MQRIAILAALLALGGCVSPEQRAMHACNNMGLSQADSAFWRCVQGQELIQQQAVANSLAGMAAASALMQPQQPVQVAPTTTACRRVGGQVICNSY